MSPEAGLDGWELKGYSGMRSSAALCLMTVLMRSESSTSHLHFNACPHSNLENQLSLIRRPAFNLKSGDEIAMVHVD